MFTVNVRRFFLSIDRVLKVSPVFPFSRSAMTTFKPIVMSGPSGCGKSTLLTRLMKEFPDCFSFSVSHTTRNPRSGEQDGREYFFVSRPEFEKMIDEGGFLEHAQFSGNRYGTSKRAVEDIQKSGRICVLDVEVNGVKNIKQTDLNARYLYIKPPSMVVLTERLKNRGTESDESLQKRLASAKESLDYANEEGSYDHYIINDDLETAYEQLRGLLIQDITTLQTEKHKSS